MCRYAEDLAMFLDCLKNSNGPKIDLKSHVDLSKLNYFYMEQDYSGLTEPIEIDIKNSLLDVAKKFNAKKIKIKNMKFSLDISMTQMLRLEDVETIYNAKCQEEGEKKTPGKELLKYFFGMSDSIFPSVLISTLQFITLNLVPNRRHIQLDRITQELKDEFKTLLGENGVLFYPCFPNSAHHHYKIYHKLVDTTYMMIFNALGLPATQVMTGFDHRKLPIGIQVRFKVLPRFSKLHMNHF